MQKKYKNTCHKHIRMQALYEILVDFSLRNNGYKLFDKP